MNTTVSEAKDCYAKKVLCPNCGETFVARIPRGARLAGYECECLICGVKLKLRGYEYSDEIRSIYATSIFVNDLDWISEFFRDTFHIRKSKKR